MKTTQDNNGQKAGTKLERRLVIHREENTRFSQRGWWHSQAFAVGLVLTPGAVLLKVDRLFSKV